MCDGHRCLVGIIGDHLNNVNDVVSFLFIDDYSAQFYLINASFNGSLFSQINQLVFPLRKIVFGDRFIDGIGLDRGNKVVLVFDARGKQSKIKIAAVTHHNCVFRYRKLSAPRRALTLAEVKLIISGIMVASSRLTCILIPPLGARNFAHGNSSRHTLIIEASTSLMCLLLTCLMTLYSNQLKSPINAPKPKYSAWKTPQSRLSWLSLMVDLAGL